jgi:pyruvate ferredoxin oxidoreductase alpha subunit
VLRQLEGSAAVAATVAACHPEVVCAYPITPQTHIVERIGALVKAGALEHCEFVNVESEFAAMSVCIGASAAGARAYTATASQGLLFMIEAVYNAAGLGLPIVMTVANRAIGAPINIWNDHSDAMAVRDAGWVQLFAETNQEAADLHVLAFRLAEELSLPVMVNIDGFVLTHAFEEVEVPEQRVVDAFLPPYSPRQVLDPADPVSIDATVGPEAFEEVRYLAHLRQLQAIERIPEIAGEFAEAFGRNSGGLVHPYRSEDAETVVVALGSVLGTLKDVVDEERAAGRRVGALGIGTFRPFPAAAVRAVLTDARRVVVVEKALAPGSGGILATDLALALASRGAGPELHAVIAGLGGRPVTASALAGVLNRARAGRLGSLTFLDLDHRLVQNELARMAATRRSGPSAENVLADLGTFGEDGSVAVPER